MPGSLPHPRVRWGYLYPVPTVDHNVLVLLVKLTLHLMCCVNFLCMNQGGRGGMGLACVSWTSVCMAWQCGKKISDATLYHLHSVYLYWVEKFMFVLVNVFINSSYLLKWGHNVVWSEASIRNLEKQQCWPLVRDSDNPNFAPYLVQNSSSKYSNRRWVEFSYLINRRLLWSFNRLAGHGGIKFLGRIWPY